MSNDTQAEAIESYGPRWHFGKLTIPEMATMIHRMEDDPRLPKMASGQGTLAEFASFARNGTQIDGASDAKAVAFLLDFLKHVRIVRQLHGGGPLDVEQLTPFLERLPEAVNYSD